MSEILGRIMLAFEGDTLPQRITDRLAAAPVAGMTLFVHHNVRTPAQVRELTDAFQHAGAARLLGSSPPPPLLVGADQEGGQLIALGEGPTPFAGNMALGAVGDVALTEAVGRAIGTEARAMGVNVIYAPDLDIASNPANPTAGIRAFGDDPDAVGRHGAAMVRGLQSAGVAATVKHAPGMGHVAIDTHHGLASVDAPWDVLRTREFVPFRASVAAGARLAMSGHFGLPAVSGRADLPSTLSRAVVTELFRGEFEFDGVTISDALDMRALAQGEAQVLDVVAAVRAGVDLLLASADPVALARIETALAHAYARDLFDAAEVAASLARIDALRRWLGAGGSAGGSAGSTGDLAVVGSAEHQALAVDLATRSITLVRDPGGRLPLTSAPGTRIIAVMPRPADLTPADTSSTVAPALAGALRDAGYADVDEIVVGQEPSDAEIAAVRARISGEAVVVVGTIDGHRQPSQIRLVECVAATGTPTIAVAMRGPWDVAAYPDDVTALATYSILPGSLGALAEVIAGRALASGVLPVRIPDRHRVVTLRDEILDQPNVAARFLARAPSVVAPLAERLRGAGVDHVVIAARGTSDHAAIYAQYVLGIRHRLSVGLGTPSVISLYGAAPRLERSLVVGISQSGASPDVVGVIAEGRRQGAPTLAITNDLTSPLAAAAEVTLDLGAGPELAVAATKTYTTTLLAVAALSAAVSGQPDDLAALAAIPDTIARTLDAESEVARMAADQAAADRLIVLARGYEYATAREWALKLKELARVFADPYSAADFEHGPVALLDPGVPVLAVVRPGPARDGLVALLGRLRDDLGVDLAVVGDDPEVLALARWPIAVPTGTPEWLGPIVSIVIGQLHAMHLTRARGLDPDAPRNLNKVTRTH